MREQAQVKSILAGWCTDLSRESRKLRIRCFSRNGRNQTLGLPDGEKEEREGAKRLKRVALQFQVHKRALSCARTCAPVVALTFYRMKAMYITYGIKVRCLIIEREL